MPQITPFVPDDWQWAPFLDKNKVMLLSGKPGGGKSYLAANKIHAYLLTYPGSTWVAARKVREDMDQSTISLFLDEVICINEEPRCTWQARKDRVVYHHPGGQISELLFKGMNTKKQREGWKSLGKHGGVDGIWFEEATEFEEEDFNLAITRIRGPKGRWRQFILSCNPDGSMHWINVRMILNSEAAYYYSDWTMNTHIDVEEYTADMNRTTNITRARMWDGRWIDGIGVVIDPWQDNYNKYTNPIPYSGNVTPHADYIPDGGPVVWVVDDGYSGEQDKKTGYFKAGANPRAFLLAQKRPNGQLAFFHEDFRVMTLEEPHIIDVIRDSLSKGYAWPNYVLYDGASPTLGRYLAAQGLNAIPFRMKIEEGLQELRNWVAADINGVRKMIVHPRLRHLRMEMVNYVYHAKKGTPIDSFNHGIDGARYLTNFISFGEPAPVDVNVPGVDMVDVERRVNEALAESEEEAIKILERIVKGKDDGNYSEFLRVTGKRTSQILQY